MLNLYKSVLIFNNFQLLMRKIITTEGENNRNQEGLLKKIQKLNINKFNKNQLKTVFLSLKN